MPVQEVPILEGISTGAKADENLDIAAVRKDGEFILRDVGTTAGVRAVVSLGTG